MMGVGVPLLMEGAIRVVSPQAQSWLDFFTQHPGGLPFYHHQPNVQKWIDVGEVRYHVVTDARGHRVASAPTVVPGGAKSVWFVGDSFTFGQGSSFEESFVGRVGAAGFRVDNGGVNGWGPAQYLADFEYNLARQEAPDAVVLGTYLGNDYFDMVWSKDVEIHDGIIGNPGGLKARLKRSSHLYRLLANIYHVYFPAPQDHFAVIDQMAQPERWLEPELSAAETSYREAIGEFASRCRRAGIPLLALVIPTEQSIESIETPGDRDHGLVTRRTLSFLRDAGIDHVDLTPVFVELGSTDSYLSFDGHLTAAANAAAARQIVEWLEANVR